ncbi:MAG: YqeG family HAD IIIA-type phosphatase [Dysosmobacter sp.]
MTLLLSDLDFTLAPKKTARPDQALRDWIAELERAGITLMIVSNNRSGRRVREFCADLGVGYQGRAGKALHPGTALCHGPGRCRADGNRYAGDRLSPMCWRPRAGVLALMVEPAGGAVTPWQKVLHALQAPFKAVCRRRRGLKNEKNRELPEKYLQCRATYGKIASVCKNVKF